MGEWVKWGKTVGANLAFALVGARRCRAHVGANRCVRPLQGRHSWRPMPLPGQAHEGKDDADERSDGGGEGAENEKIQPVDLLVECVDAGAESLVQIVDFLVQGV